MTLCAIFHLEASRSGMWCGTTEESKGMRLARDPHHYVTARSPQYRQWYPSGLICFTLSNYIPPWHRTNLMQTKSKRIFIILAHTKNKISESVMVSFMDDWVACGWNYESDWSLLIYDTQFSMLEWHSSKFLAMGTSTNTEDATAFTMKYKH